MNYPKPIPCIWVHVLRVRLLNLAIGVNITVIFPLKVGHSLSNNPI